MEYLQRGKDWRACKWRNSRGETESKMKKEKMRCNGGGRRAVPRELAGTGAGPSASAMRTGPGTQTEGRWRWWPLQDSKE